MKILELYAGIGGVAEALRGSDTDIVAVEQSLVAAGIYRDLHAHELETLNILTLGTKMLEGFGADLWWLSPPCQPFTVRGVRRDLKDRRTESLVHLVRQIPVVRPERLILENVPGFEGSCAERILLQTLEAEGYDVARIVLCPTELGIPNRRRRYYLLASRVGSIALAAVDSGSMLGLASYLEGPVDLVRYAVLPRTVDRYAWAMSVVEPTERGEIAACFTAAYGRSPVRSGSFIRQGDRVRRFTENEILRLLGFSRVPQWPARLPLEKRYQLVGNAVSVVAARWLLRQMGVRPKQSCVTVERTQNRRDGP